MPRWFLKGARTNILASPRRFGAPPGGKAKIERMTSQRILLSVLLAWALVMIVPDVLRVVQPLGSFGFYADNDGLIYDVTGPFDEKEQSPAWNAGIRAGDRLAICPKTARVPKSAPNEANSDRSEQLPRRHCRPSGGCSSSRVSPHQYWRIEGYGRSDWQPA